MTQTIFKQVRWTIADLEGFPTTASYEIIDGELFVTRAHTYRLIRLLIYAELLRWSPKCSVNPLSPRHHLSESDSVTDVIWINANGEYNNR